MSLYDLADPTIPLPTQLVVDTSLLLALRPEDDNPHAAVARAFMRLLEQRIAAYQLVAWLPLPVLQECYHIILSNALRRAWEQSDPGRRPPNWLRAYKENPALLRAHHADLIRFRELLAAIPLTLIRPEDLAAAPQVAGLDERLLHFIQAYDLLPQDALILAHAECIGVSAVATLDQDWRRVAVVDVYTCF
ncbi:MAG: PIN domain-containing protein [Anaerolineae bacterium]|nr:PIN domain-containing protein [Anaerolineae bacterium]